MQSDYSHNNLVKTCEEVYKCAAGFRGVYSDLPVLPECGNDPLVSLQNILDWSMESSKVVNNIISGLKRQTIRRVISQFKKLRGFADKALSLVDNTLKEEARKEARTRFEKEYKNLNNDLEKAHENLNCEIKKTSNMLEISPDKLPLVPLCDYSLKQIEIDTNNQSKKYEISQQEKNRRFKFRVALIIAFERQIEDFCLLARKANQLYP